ncbi:MAG: hypothetical protein M9962_04165 [Oligoflexia bacterium]|nr:hypothetical protein [Oligoflexia bacterium]
MKLFLSTLTLFALLSTPTMASIKVDMSGCVPFMRNVQGSSLDFQIDPQGNLVFNNKDPMITSSKRTDKVDSIKKKIVGQSGQAHISLTRTTNGYPAKVEIIEPQYDSNKPSETLTFNFAYKDGGDGKNHCYVKDYQIHQHEGQYKGKTFVYYNNDLCTELEEALDANTDDLIKRCAPVIGHLQAVINAQRTSYKKEKKDLYQYIDSNEDGSNSLARIINTLGDCRSTRRDLFPNYKYPIPSRRKGITIPAIHIRPIQLFNHGSTGTVEDSR